MMETEENKQKRIDILEAKVAALTLSVKAANNQYKGSLLKNEVLKQKYEQLDADHSKTIEDYNRLLVFVDSLQENISIDKCMLWAAKTEKQSSKELKQLRKDLADYTLINQEKSKDLDIAEADAPPQTSNDAVIAGILGDKPVTLEDSNKKWGRQPGVRTRGRNMSSFDVLPRHEVNNDLREVSDAEYAATLTFIKTVTHSQLDYVK